MIYDTLAEAVKHLTPGGKQRVYSVANDNLIGNQTYYVVCQSPGQAALQIVGPENIELVPQSERYQAALTALMEQKK